MLASAVFFVLLGPLVGALVLAPRIGLLGALMMAHAVGFLPALLAGLLNAMMVASGIVRSRSLLSRCIHAVVGGLCGFVATIIVFDYYSDWVLIRRTTDWYDVWYTFNRAYREFAVPGLVAGAVCASIFNPWAQARYAFRRLSRDDDASAV